MKTKKFAIVLAGCGVYDGAEIQETVATLLAIDKFECEYQCFAPDIKQYHVVNHLNGEEMDESRNVLVEAARIARGDIKKLVELKVQNFDAIIFPGGFGVAKNLCTFAIDGPDCLINPVVERTIKEAHDAKLPIGALCISPALIVAVLQDVEVTIGSDENTASALESLGAKHRNTKGSEIVIDQQNKLITSPCYMLDERISTIAQGAENVVAALIEMIDKS